MFVILTILALSAITAVIWYKLSIATDQTELYRISVTTQSAHVNGLTAGVFYPVVNERASGTMITYHVYNDAGVLTLIYDYEIDKMTLTTA